MSYAGTTTAISYDNDSLVTGIHGYTLGLKANNALPETVSDNTFVQTRGYNGYGEVTTTSTQVNNQSTYDYSLTYNDLGQIVTKQETLHNGSVNNYVYTYDPNRRWLTMVTKNNVLVESYAYDANGNRTLYTNTALNINGKVPTYNIADQLTSDGHIYDVDGYLTQKTINGVTTQYQYSSRGQLVSVQAPSLNITYQHNAMGNRVAKRVNGTITEKYLWQDKTTLLAVYNPDNSLKQRFEYTLGNTPTSFTQAGQKYYIVSDHLGSPRVITDSNVAVLKAYSFDAFGNQSTITDNDPTMEIPFGFAGGLYDTDTGLIRFGYRDYDPETGRWTARDPIGLNGGDGDVYAYVGNSPINQIDSLGLCGPCIQAVKHIVKNIPSAAVSFGATYGVSRANGDGYGESAINAAIAGGTSLIFGGTTAPTVVASSIVGNGSSQLLTKGTLDLSQLAVAGVVAVPAFQVGRVLDIFGRPIVSAIGSEYVSQSLSYLANGAIDPSYIDKGSYCEAP